MFSKILQSLDKSDYQFLAKIEDPKQKKNYIKQLRHSRLHYAIILWLAVVLIIATIFLDQDAISPTFLLVVGTMGYLDAESKLRLIYAMELFQASTSADTTYRDGQVTSENNG